MVVGHKDTSSFPDLLDVIIVGAGPCGLAVAARMNEDTPSAMFTDEEHQRYHWINKHRGRMALVQAHHHKMNGVKADKWRGLNARRPSHQSSSSVSISEMSSSPSPPPPSSSPLPSLASSVSSSPSETEIPDQRMKPDQRKKTGGGLSTLVLDSTGEKWMERWNRAFRTLEIEQLRSPIDRDGMLAYTQETGREKDLWEISGCVGKELSKHKKKKKMRTRAQVIGYTEIDERDRKDYFSPSTDLFADYCSSIISQYRLDLPGMISQREVVDIQYSVHAEISPSDKIFAVTAADGTRFYSRSVVLAIGPGTTKIYPFKLTREEEQGACHSTEIRSFPSPNVKRKIQQREETNLVVVGGGLSSAQVADMAIRRGVSKVWLLMRSDFKIKHFDLGLSWMGKFKNYEKAAFWSADTDDERLDMIREARNGGSITPRYTKILKQHMAHQRVSIHTRTVICDRDYCTASQTWRLSTDPPIPDLPRIDYIYFATGMKLDVNELPLLQWMHREYPIETKQGLPCITDDLMWQPEVPLFLTGRLAALRLGPGAPNLEGARLGAERVAWGMEEVLGRSDSEEDLKVQRSQECFCGLGNRYAELEEVNW
ncbi:FAD binding domain protein [Aspergillus tanneri]|uniref:L-ornithine N(5)-monooxygenase n=1 Tax=Aspergillus tanneri TaxID=1220188 RepID=A0A5M9ML84_9EURO|nr:uncharacterized protein ATNIH1004_007610 [Aspergillus tanneri]KAA8646184.1 hypothetical protein ATNIH1004_007610 [Aspergillus tanneri]